MVEENDGLYDKYNHQVIFLEILSTLFFHVVNKFCTIYPMSQCKVNIFLIENKKLFIDVEGCLWQREELNWGPN